MPLDAITLSALCGELSEKLVGGRIDKVQQPERDMLILSLRSQGENLRLLISAGTGSARAHFTHGDFENPTEPPMFCMLMRKHLVGGRINAVTQPDMERMLVIDFSSRDELGISTDKKLIVEMIGRSSNVILVGEDGRIIDCMRRADFGGDTLRRMLPGMIYRLPPRQDKTRFMSTTAEQRLSMAQSADRGQSIDKWLLDSFSGLSPLICRELAFRCGDSFERLPAAMDALFDTVTNRELVPAMLIRDGAPADFSFMPISQYGAAGQTELYPDFSSLLDSFYSRREKQQQQRRRSKELSRSVRNMHDRLQRKLNEQRQELKRTENKEDIRKRAELVTANIYRMKKGERRLVCQDYYSEGCPEIEIELDPLKTPQKNAAALYKQYNKLKGAEEHLTVLIEKGDRELEYLSSVLDELERAESSADLESIRRELTAQGYIRISKGEKPRRVKEQAPLRFVTDDGFTVLVGRSNVQNDELTTKTARRTDYWLHTKNIHGSHVILCCEGEEPSELAITQAAALAVYYSQAREAGSAPVDYTMVRFVRKPSGALPGKVIYTNQHTIIAGCDEALTERLRQK